MADERPAIAVAEDVNVFLQSKTGIAYLNVLQSQYNQWHHAAEQAGGTMEGKAMLVERAAGLRYAIDWLQERNDNYANGYYEKKK